MTTRKALPERKDPQKALNRQNTHTTRVGRQSAGEVTASKQARCLPGPACCSIYGDRVFAKKGSTVAGWSVEGPSLKEETLRASCERERDF